MNLEPLAKIVRLPIRLVTYHWHLRRDFRLELPWTI